MEEYEYYRLIVKNGNGSDCSPHKSFGSVEGAIEAAFEHINWVNCDPLFLPDDPEFDETVDAGIYETIRETLENFEVFEDGETDYSYEIKKCSYED